MYRPRYLFRAVIYQYANPRDIFIITGQAIYQPAETLEIEIPCFSSHQACASRPAVIHQTLIFSGFRWFIAATNSIRCNWTLSPTKKFSYNSIRCPRLLGTIRGWRTFFCSDLRRKGLIGRSSFLSGDVVLEPIIRDTRNTARRTQLDWSTASGSSEFADPAESKINDRREFQIFLQINRFLLQKQTLLIFLHV